MRHVVYVLGAGFSAPLGLPVMANFLDKAKDQYYETTDRYEHFGRVLETISKLHVANAYYATDLFNIEDILSILDMQDRLIGTDQGALFKRFLADVVAYYTPAAAPPPERPQVWCDHFFGGDLWRFYGSFAAIVLGYRFERTSGPTPGNATTPTYRCVRDDSATITYSLISLNYDLVLENAAQLLIEREALLSTFARNRSTPGTPLIKLHGSIDSDDIVPPTWSKSTMTATTQAAWADAYAVLSRANEIRILGFSLPDADAYIRYLLRAAVIDTPNLKRIHVLCRDPSGNVKDRYTDFVRFRSWRFEDVDVMSYLGPIGQNEQWPLVVDAQALERAHAIVFGVDR